MGSSLYSSSKTSEVLATDFSISDLEVVVFLQKT